MTLGPFESRIQARIEKLEQGGFLRKLLERDVSLWKKDPAHQGIIGNRLGWLDLPGRMSANTDEISEFTDEVRRGGFTGALLLGMGGSVLFPEVCRMTFGVKPSFLDVGVLDSTHPAAIDAAERKLNLAKTLFIVSSKSGTTTETLAFFSYFFDRVSQADPEGAGGHFIAITDPGTPLETLAKEHKFRRVFTNPADVGGRFSALSYFGLVPASLLGVDVTELLNRAAKMSGACDAGTRAADDPGVRLGAAMAEFASSGRPKVTFALSPEFSSFGSWVEQLLAESVGKEGKGLIPVVDEPLGEPSVYGEDRFFVSIALAGSADGAAEDRLRQLEEKGHPVIRITLKDPLDLGAECYRWQRATAVAGALFKINPFDEPNVKESKDNTRELLDGLEGGGSLPEVQSLLVEEGPLALYGDPQPGSRDGSLEGALASFLGTAGKDDYVSWMAYLSRTPEYDALLQAIRFEVRDSLHAVTTLGYGPRYLHSTGQLHKGGPATGLFILVTAEEMQGTEIPGEPHTFGVLLMAQALGDLRALKGKGRRVIRIHIKQDIKAGLGRLAEVVKAACAARARN